MLTYQKTHKSTSDTEMYLTNRNKRFTHHSKRAISAKLYEWQYLVLCCSNNSVRSGRVGFVVGPDVSEDFQRFRSPLADLWFASKNIQKYVNFKGIDRDLFVEKYKEGLTARKILTDCGYNPEIFGDRRVQGISHHIREQYEETGGVFTEGHTGCSKIRKPSAKLSENEELKQLRQEVDYLKQEIEFLKKISSIRTTRK